MLTFDPAAASASKVFSRLSSLSCQILIKLTNLTRKRQGILVKKCFWLKTICSIIEAFIFFCQTSHHSCLIMYGSQFAFVISPSASWIRGLVFKEFLFFKPISFILTGNIFTPLWNVINSNYNKVNKLLLWNISVKLGWKKNLDRWH